MRIVSSLILLALCQPAMAAKDGMYLAIGISGSSYVNHSGDSFLRVVDGERAGGWRAEIGHIWDLGKAGGFQLGVAGAFDHFGEVSDSGRFGDETGEVELDARALSAYFVIDQELTRWLDFMFKIGPAGIEYQARACCTAQGRDIVDERKSRLGASSVIGLVFFPAEHIGIELAAQATAWYTGDLRDVETEDDLYDYLDTRVAARSLSASFQYRF